MPSRTVRDVLADNAEGYVVPGANANEFWSEGERGHEGELESKSDEEVEAAVVALDVPEDDFEYALAVEISKTEALEPRTLIEARARADWPRWNEVIKEELETLRAAGTWVFEAAPPNANVIGSKWVFKAKKDAAGNVVRYKARLVTQGYNQVSGVNYFNTYAPVAKLPSVLAVLAIANRQNMEPHQVDITSTAI